MPSLFIPVPVSAAPERLELHPNPKQVFKLWQTFVDNVNPLTKIIHAPTLQGRIFEAAWAVESVPRPLEAIMLAVYALAVVSLKPADCIHILGERKQVLVSRFRTGALWAFSNTDLLSTRDLEVLQALALILMIDPQSEFSTTAVALTLRIAHKMKLHRAAEDSDMPFFKQEMQVRLWWYIRGLNSRARRGIGLISTIDDLGDVRLPMNVNDADLHQYMTKPPAVQHTAATEMVYCLMKYDLWTFVRKSSNFSNSLNPREIAAELVTSTSAESMAKKRKVLGEVESMLQERYLAHLDPSIPLHHLSATMAGITIHHQRFLMFHPQNQPEGGRYVSRADEDLVFESSVRLLEFDRDVRNTSFSIKLVDHMACRTQIQALVYMVSQLKVRTSGQLVETGWSLLEEIHEEQPVALQGDHKFYTALTDLILEAWQARSRALELRAEDAPMFIQILLVSRAEIGAATEPTDMEGLQTGLMDNFTCEDPLDSSYWDGLLEL
ncbi:fungal specific transcription factor protein [Rutstroemia sp. NJR-2017a WRK4]|nr:fungal specific transcription factor protein [Rutstroemia sp. NJR-2017a WRK4]